MLNRGRSQNNKLQPKVRRLKLHAVVLPVRRHFNVPLLDSERGFKYSIFDMSAMMLKHFCYLWLPNSPSSLQRTQVKEK